MSLGFVLLPGLLAGIQAVFFRGKLDLGLTRGGGWSSRELGGPLWAALAPLYLLVMPAFWVVVPIVRYLELAGHLVAVRRGDTEYDDTLRQRVWTARELEGLGETLLQLTMQLQLLVRSYDAGSDKVDGDDNDVGDGIGDGGDGRDGEEIFSNVFEEPTFKSRSMLLRYESHLVLLLPFLDILPYLQMSTSLLSFLWTVVGSQGLQVCVRESKC